MKRCMLSSSCLASGMKEIENYVDFYESSTDKCLWGSIQKDSATTWIGIPFSAIHTVLKIDKNTIDISPKDITIRDIIHTWIQDTIRGELCRRRSERIKEELVAAVWHPRRVARRLEEDGWEALDAL